MRIGQDKINTEIEGMKKRLDVQGERITLIGAIINENAVCQKRGDRDLIYFNQDWTLTRDPRYLEGRPEDMEWIRSRVSPPPR